AQAVSRRLPVVREVRPTRKWHERPARSGYQRPVLCENADDKLQTLVIRRSRSEFTEKVPSSKQAMRRLSGSLSARNNSTTKNSHKAEIEIGLLHPFSQNEMQPRCLHLT